MTLSDLPLETRCLAAIVVILEDAALDVRGRLEVLGAALWPTMLAPAEPPAPGVGAMWSTVDDRDYARRSFRAGYTVSEIAEELDVEWRVVNEWCNTRG